MLLHHTSLSLTAPQNKSGQRGGVQQINCTREIVLLQIVYLDYYVVREGREVSEREKSGVREQRKRETKRKRDLRGRGKTLVGSGEIR